MTVLIMSGAAINIGLRRSWRTYRARIVAKMQTHPATRRYTYAAQHRLNG